MQIGNLYAAKRTTLNPNRADIFGSTVATAKSLGTDFTRSFLVCRRRLRKCEINISVEVASFDVGLQSQFEERNGDMMSDPAAPHIVSVARELLQCRD